MVSKMIKSEFLSNLFSWILLTGISIGLFVLFTTIFSIINVDLAKIANFIDKIPDKVLALLNLDVVDLTNISGWLKTIGSSSYILIGTIYSMVLGYTIVRRGPKNLLQKVLSTASGSEVMGPALIVKFFVGIVYILCYAIAMIVFMLISSAIVKANEILTITKIMFAPILTFFTAFSFGFMLSMYVKKMKAIVAICSIFVILSYLFKYVGDISDKVFFLKYLSVFTISDIRAILTNQNLKVWNYIIQFSLVGVSLLLSWIKYMKIHPKDTVQIVRENSPELLSEIESSENENIASILEELK